MVITPLGRIKIYVDGVSIDYDAYEHCYNRPPVKEKPIAGCYRVEVDTKEYHSISCVIELIDTTIRNTGASGERYLDAEFMKDNVILTIGMEDENTAFESVRLPNGLLYNLKHPTPKVRFGIAWATDYEGSEDVRTWFAADPTMD